MPKPYPKEFREDVVRVARNREPTVTPEQIAAEFGEYETCRPTDGRWGGAGVADGRVDCGARHRLVEGLEAAMGERGESTGISFATTPVRLEAVIRARRPCT